MRKALIIAITGIDPKRFDTLRMRGQLPIALPSKGWADYSLDDAFRLRLMMDLIDDGGVAVKESAMIAQFGVSQSWVKHHPLERSQEPRADIWSGSVIYISNWKRPEERRELQHFSCVSGEIEQIAKGSVLRLFPDAEIIRVTAVNASRAARYVIENAFRLGLPEALEVNFWHRPVPTEEVEEKRFESLEAAD